MTAPNPTWSGVLALGSGIVSYVGPGAIAGSHRHDAIQLIWSPTRPVRIGTEDESITTHLALVPSRQQHHVDAEGALLALVLVEPTGLLGRRLDALASGHAATDLDDRLAGVTIPDRLDAISLTEWSRGLLARLLGGTGPTTPGRVRAEVLEASSMIDARLARVPRLDEVARQVGLSPRQLRRSFADEIGMPYRRYVLWRRLRRALLAVSCGADLTTAAAEAGFSDSAHLSRTFRETFGLAPSDVLPLLTVVEGDFPTS